MTHGVRCCGSRGMPRSFRTHTTFAGVVDDGMYLFKKNPFPSRSDPESRKLPGRLVYRRRFEVKGLRVFPTWHM